MDILLRPLPPSHAAPSAALPSSKLLPFGNSRSSSFFRPSPGLKMRLQTGTTARLRLVSRCAADRPCEPSPDEDPRAARYRRFRDDMDKYSREYGAALRALGAGSSIDATVQELEATLFRDEEDKLQTCVREITDNHCILYKEEGRGLAQMVCLRVGMAIHLSAMITANARLRVVSSSEMSSHTVEQIIRTYVSTFLKTAEDTCHGKVNRTSIISFIDALRGLAAISHILFEDALAVINNIEDTSSNYSPEYDVEALHNELLCSIKELERNFTAAPERKAYELLWPTLTDATHHVSIFVIRMTNLRKKAVAHIQARSNAEEQTNNKKDDASRKINPES